MRRYVDTGRVSYLSVVRDTQTGEELVLKRSRIQEYRASKLAEACGINTVALRPAGRGRYVMPFLPDATDLTAYKGRLTGQMQTDLLTGLMFGYVVAEGDRHGGNALVHSGRIYMIDMEYVGLDRAATWDAYISCTHPAVSRQRTTYGDVETATIKETVATLREHSEELKRLSIGARPSFDSEDNFNYRMANLESGVLKWLSR